MLEVLGQDGKWDDHSYIDVQGHVLEHRVLLEDSATDNWLAGGRSVACSSSTRMRNLTSAIAVLLSAVIVLARYIQFSLFTFVLLSSSVELQSTAAQTGDHPFSRRKFGFGRTVFA